MTIQILQADQLELAADLLRAGQLVAFPTETVFGLGALATDEAAVARVYHAKGRPSDNPLIVHVASVAQAKQYVKEINPIERALMEHFWPGPLTLILPVLSGVIAPNAIQGQETVGLRMPANDLTLALIKATGQPLVGPSANLSTKPSPTHYSHVVHDFKESVAAVLDDGLASRPVGVESTVVRVVNGQVRILRPGAITASMLKKVTPNVVEMSAQAQLQDGQILSPGVKYRHYSPSQPVFIVPQDKYHEDDWAKLLDELTQFPDKIGLLADENILIKVKGHSKVSATFSLGKSGQIQSATQSLYAGLRYFDQTDCRVILAQGLENNETAHAFMNRLSKAATGVL